MTRSFFSPRSFLSLCLASTALASLSVAAHAAPPGYDKIDTVVVIYAENRSFDNLYGGFPGANGLANVSPDQARQLDRDGKPLSELPPAWGGLTGKGVTPAVTEAQSAHLANATFAIDDPKGFNEGTNVVTHDLWHRFYQEQMQIDGGRNDKFVAWADSGSLVMGHYDGSSLPMWAIAKKYVLADNFFQGAFGGSFLNHFMLACACAPYYPNADTSPVKGQIAVVEPDGVTLKPADNSPPSALGGVPKFANDGAITPDFYAVNTMQPPYQPSANKPAEGGDKALADPAQPTTLPPQHEITIGDLLSLKGVSWAWYSGAWQAALDGKNATPVPNFQVHHQPYNYFAAYAPGTAARAEHLKDGGLDGTEFIKAIDDGKLPADEEAWPVFERLFEENGLPDRIRSDNGPPFASAGMTGLTPLAVRFIKLGIALERIQPGKPQQNGRHERFHLTMLPMAHAPQADRAAQASAFEDFRRSYNEERPHEALGMDTPAQHYRPSTRPMPKTVPEPDYPTEAAVRGVRQNGAVKWRGTEIYVSATLAGEPVAIEETESGAWAMRFYAHPLGFIDEKHMKLVRRSAAPTRPLGAAATAS